MVNLDTSLEAWELRSATGCQTYSLFGLSIASEVPLPCPELRGYSATPDLELRQATEQQIDSLFTSAATAIDEDGFWQCRMYPDGAARVCCGGHFEFAVSSDGRRVLWRKFVEISDEVVFTYLLGQVLSFCLLA